MRKRIAKNVKRLMIHLTLDQKDYRAVLRKKREQSFAEYTRNLIKISLKKQ